MYGVFLATAIPRHCMLYLEYTVPWIVYLWVVGTVVLILDRLGSCKVLSLQGTSQEAVSPDGQNRAREDVQALHRWMLGAGRWFTLGGRAAWVSNSFLRSPSRKPPPTGDETDP